MYELVKMASCSMVIPLMMIFFGMAFKKGYPRKINKFFGFRTAMSMKNSETWLFAHNLCGKIWLFLGFVLFFLTLVFIVFVIYKKNINVETIVVINLSVQAICMLATIIPVEKNLKKNFDESGKRIL